MPLELLIYRQKYRLHEHDRLGLTGDFHTKQAAWLIWAPPHASDAYALMRLPRVLQVTELKKTTLYGLMRRNGFPRPVRLTDRLVAWRSADIAVWAEARETKQSAGRSISGVDGSSAPRAR